MNGLGRLAGRVALVLALPAALLAAWWVLSAGSTNYYAPPLRDIASAFRHVWLSRRLREDVLPSLLRLLAGYAAAGVLGVAAGVAIGLSRRVRVVTEPVLEFFRAIPPPVLVPILMLFAGIGSTMKILVIVSGCVWPVLLNTAAGVRGLDPVLVETARSYRLPPLTRLRTLVLRGASPQIMTGLRQALSVGIILMVISEMFAANNGLGFAIVQFQNSFDIPQMWSGTLMLGIIGVLLAGAFALVERRVLGWYRGARRAERGR